MGWTAHVPVATIDAHRRDDQLSHTLPSSDVQVDQLGGSRYAYLFIIHFIPAVVMCYFISNYSRSRRRI